MIRRVLRIGRWTVDFLFAPDGYDVDGVLGCMYDMDASDGDMDDVEDLMYSGGPNCGYTYADGRIRRAMVLVGPTTGGDEFLDTLVHELGHLSVAIAGGLGLSPRGEGPAYIIGGSARALAGTICELGCGCHC